jgi:hypothetical protein
MSATERGAGAARALLAGLALAGIVAGCASSPIPQARLPSEEDAITAGFGSYIQVIDAGGAAHDGELIEVQPGRLSIFDGGHIEVLARPQVASALVVVHQTHQSAYAVWTVLGTLSTITHGFFLVLSAPVWIATGVTTSISESRRARLTYPDPARWEDLRPYARFPQGLPPGITGNELLHGRMFPAPAAPPPS